MVGLVREFYDRGKLSKAVTSSFIAMIPKNSCPQSLAEYRPISLIGCIYKAISKLIYSRLSRVLGSVINEC